MTKKTSNYDIQKGFDFSKALKELEQITDYLESPDVELDKAVDKFKRGAELAKDIKSYLENTENIVQSIKADFK